MLLLNLIWNKKKMQIVIQFPGVLNKADSENGMIYKHKHTLIDTTKAQQFPSQRNH